MKETPDTISAWAVATFGDRNSVARVIARANEEGAELLRELTAGNRPEKMAQEAADIVIVLCRAGLRHIVNAPAGMAPSLTRAEIAVSIGDALLKALNAALTGGAYDVHVRSAMIRCAALCACYGRRLTEEVDAKMAVNRGRQWHHDGTGHGYHVRDKEAVA